MPSAETTSTLSWSLPVTAILTAAVSVIGTIYAMRPRPAGEMKPGGMGAIGSLLKDTVTYIPHILLLFGIIADMLSSQVGVYTIPSLIGFLSIFINWGFSFFWNGMVEVITKVKEVLNTKPNINPRANVPTLASNPLNQQGGALGDFFKDYDGCNVQGFSRFRSKYAPQTLVVTATVFCYYIFDLIMNRGLTNAIASIVLFIALFAGEALIIGNCSVGIDEPKTVYKALISLVEGITIGGSGYAIVQASNPTMLPSAAIPSFPRKTKNDLKPGPNGTMVDENGDPYIILPNGQAVPDMCSEESRKSFADLVADNIGSGQAALPASCSA